MKDRVDEMSHDELKAATRKLVEAAGWGIKSTGGYVVRLREAIAPFQTITLDKVRELLRAEGWIKLHCKRARDCSVAAIEMHDDMGTIEGWTKP